MNNNFKTPLYFTSALALSMGSFPAYAVLDLTDIGYVQYGDGQSYSLPIAQIQDGCTGPGCDYYVASTPGNIKDLIVVATGSSGTPVNTNYAGMDDAYSTPSGVSGSNYFSTDSYADPGGAGESGINHDYDNTWDASLSSMMNFLNGEDMIVFFNNNNLNAGNEQSLAAWGQITITDADGNLVDASAYGIQGDITDLARYDFTNDDSPYALVTNGGGGTFLGDVASYQSDGSSYPDAGDYVLSGGPICVNTTVNPSQPIPVDCGGAGPYPVDEGPINHNLGADQAAYALLFPELNALLEALFAGLTTEELALYTIHMDIRMGCDASYFGNADSTECVGSEEGGLVDFGRNLNNGYEQIFIGTARTVENIPVPEPGTLLMFALGLLGLGTLRHQRDQG